MVGEFAGPFGSAAIPHVVEKDHLPAANAAFAVATNAAALVGFPLGGLMLGHFGLPAVVIVDALSFLLSGLLIAFVAVPLENRAVRARGHESTALRRARSEWLLGLSFVGSERWISAVFIVVTATFFGTGLHWSVLPAFVRGTLGGSAQFYSWVLTAQGAGGITAGIVVARVMRHISPGHLLTWGLVVLGLLDL